jgi:thymidylate kinase
MFTVAIIGPDGAGKTTIGRRLEQRLRLPVKYLYMGVSRDSSNYMFPTSRLIQVIKRMRGAKPDTGRPHDSDHAKARPKGMIKRVAVGIRLSLSLSNQIIEEWFRQALAWFYQHKGYVVLFDRHFFADYYAFDIAGNSRGRPLARRIHGFMLDRVYPRPHLVIYLDAPAELLFARKGEGTLKSLEYQRQGYLQIRDQVKNFVIVDASQPEDAVAREVTAQIWNYYKSRAGA